MINGPMTVNSDFDLHAGLLNHTVPQSESAHPESSHSTQLNSVSSSLPTSNAGEVTTAMTDEMTTAVTNLLSYATHNNFSIHDVPGDGNCLFNAVLYQIAKIARLINDAWGDHLIISALSDMFSVTINVHHANEQTCTVVVRTPTESVSTSEVNMGSFCNTILFAWID